MEDWSNGILEYRVIKTLSRGICFFEPILPIFQYSESEEINCRDLGKFN
jgi:hypothetical protein